MKKYLNKGRYNLKNVPPQFTLGKGHVSFFYDKLGYLKERYIEVYNESFQIDKICEKIKESQTDKVFLLWDCENFHTQVLDVENVTIQKIQKVDDMYFDVETAEFQYDIRVRIRWANNNGLANPTWKFTFIQK